MILGSHKINEWGKERIEKLYKELKEVFEKIIG